MHGKLKDAHGRVIDEVTLAESEDGDLQQPPAETILRGDGQWASQSRVVLFSHPVESATITVPKTPSLFRVVQSGLWLGLVGMLVVIYRIAYPDYKADKQWSLAELAACLWALGMFVLGFGIAWAVSTVLTQIEKWWVGK